ncbi:MAG: PRC-barrel domain-containing protein [Methanophagales archaeon]|nr:PRC-barrel domain-containing protein [Methanophagales archaeon]
MWGKKRKKEEKEKVIAYLRSRLFPWNFILEEVEEEAIAHFIPYAIQMCEAKGIERRSVGKGEVKEVITKEVKDAVNDYLFDPRDKEMVKMHGEFASIYPFAFSQCLAYTILYRLGLEMGAVVDVKAISELLGLDINEIKRREFFIHDVTSRRGNRAMKVFGKSILNKKVITAEGDFIGSVGDLIFAEGTGLVEGLIVNHQKGSELMKSRISMNDVRLNMYSKNIVIKYSNYAKK